LLLSAVGVAGAAEWRPVTTELLATAKPGYGGLSGVAVDRRSGHIYIDVSDRGIYHSTDLKAPTAAPPGRSQSRCPRN
jgi:hypothetical protein